MTKHILLTGGSGFLGSNIVRELISQNYKVTVLVRTNSSLSRLDSCIEKINVCIADNLEECFSQNVFDGIIHTATSYGRKEETLVNIVNSNVSFPLRLLSLAIEYKVSFFINTDTSLPANINNYSLSKSHFRDWLKHYSANIKVINIIPEYFYGPHDDQTKFISGVMSRFKRNDESIDFTEGLQERDFIYIDDVISAYLFIVKNVESFTDFVDIPLGTSHTIRLRDLVELIKNMVDNKSTILNFGKIPTRDGDLMYSKANLEILNSLGWKPMFTLKEGLEKMIKIENNKNID